MHPWLLTVAVLSYCFLTPIFAFRISCVSLKRPLPTWEDCNQVLGYMEHKISSAFSRDPYWGQTLANDFEIGTYHLPQGFRITSIYPSEEVPQCEIYLDNIPGKEKLCDQFGWKQIVQATQAMMGECYPKGKGGVVDVTGKGVVFLTTKQPDQALAMSGIELLNISSGFDGDRSPLAWVA